MKTDDALWFIGTLVRAARDRSTADALYAVDKAREVLSAVEGRISGSFRARLHEDLLLAEFQAVAGSGAPDSKEGAK